MITLRGKLKRSTVSRPKVADAAAITQRQPGSGGGGGEATNAASADQTTTVSGAISSGTNEMEMVEEWKWEGVWAFGSLPNNQEEIDKLLNPPPLPIEEFDDNANKDEQSVTTTAAPPKEEATNTKETFPWKTPVRGKTSYFR